jgi:hypothetical protein
LGKEPGIWRPKIEASTGGNHRIRIGRRSIVFGEARKDILDRKEQSYKPDTSGL